MDDNLTELLIVMVGMLGLVLLRYLKYLNAKRSDSGRLNSRDNAALEQMAQTASRLEQRAASLEKILDHEVPAWRANPDHYYQQAG